MCCASPKLRNDVLINMQKTSGVSNYNTNQILSEVFSDTLYPYFIAGPCAVESYDMMDKIAKYLVAKGINAIRAGAFKPRTCPDEFQGLGIEALEILDKIRKKYKVKIVSEIVDIRYLDKMLDTVDILQVGTRNMHNFELLKALGRINFPILLKRGFNATIKEFIAASSYILQGGNEKVLLCERGIRSFDAGTRNLLDLSCVAIIKYELKYPIIVDISHSLGRKDIALPMAKAALAAGADGIMVEVHNNPSIALSDANQQMSILEFNHFYNELIHTYNGLNIINDIYNNFNH